MKRVFLIVIVLFSMSFLFFEKASSCTNILVSKGATKDGSAIITYSCDGEFLPHLRYTPAADHKKDEFIEIRTRDGKVHKIPQVPHTYAVVGLMNEFQLAIGETTFDGRKELRNPDGLLHYWTLMNLALKRAKTAREAIKVITDLVEKYGYASTGETFSIADPNEVWIMDMIGPGPGGKGAVWVALRVPEGYMCAHANMSRIGEFPLNDTKNCMHSKNVISIAEEKGYFDRKSGKPFRFCDVYDPATPEKCLYCGSRVWSIFRRSAPSKNFLSDFARGVKGAERLPLFIKPDSKFSVKDVMSLMRDHYEGTPFDMTKGVDAGPFGTPNRWRPITWKVDSVKYAWERPISTQQTGFSFVSQSRSYLPDAVGGVLWYGMDDTYTTCYIPLYCRIDALPEAFTVGSMRKFSFDSAWWAFNFVANIANLKYSYMIKDIQKVQSELENNFFELQPAVEKTALELSKKNPELMKKYLTDYSVMHGQEVVRRWEQLGKDLIVKYNDGYVKNEKGGINSVGYPEQWLKRVIKSRGNSCKVPVWK
ncbi:C69 family dipeptidase [bacterium]|nr:C69 family dipeptidase [bacterium]